MIITLSCVVSLSFLFYVVVFGGSSTGLIGRLHRTITRCSCFTLCCGDRCGRGLQRTEEVCCLRPNPALQLFYLGLVFSGLALFMYSSFPFVANPRLAEWHTYSPYPAVSAGLLSFFLACYCDPGTISAASLHRFSREPFDGVIYKPKMCPTCLIPRPARSKHCVICNRCVAKFDHHCPWINTCVGERNYRFFLFFLGYHAALCFYAAYLHYHILNFLAWDVHRLHEAYYIDLTGQHVRVSRWQGFQYLLLRHNVVVAVGIFCFVIALALLGFWGYHIWLIRCGTTTNETFKWSDLRFDHTRSAKKAGGGRAPAIRVPPNAYNRGFWRNMADVLFPLSSRRADDFAAAVAAGGASAGFCDPDTAGEEGSDGGDSDGEGGKDVPAVGTEEGPPPERVRQALHED